MNPLSLWKHDLMILAAVGAMVALADEAGDAEITAQHVKQATVKKEVKPEDRFAMRFPIGLESCDAVTRSGYHAHKMTEPKCYVRSR